MSDSDGAGMPLEVEPIDVDSTDEIGEVARAFDQVHREALRLAANEAALRGNVNAMFVNLSRRSQSLVERQIRLIDDLEQGEQDSDRLSSLFQMDHLATRMRRNSENLLVLAGHDATQAVEPAGRPRRRAARRRLRDRAIRARYPQCPAGHRGARACRQRCRPPARRAGGERDLVLLCRDPRGRGRSPAEQRRRAAGHHRPGRRHGRRGDGARQLAARQPAGGRRGRVPPDGPVRGRPAGGAARHPGPAAACVGGRPHRAGLAAGRGRQPRGGRWRSRACAGSIPPVAAGALADGSERARRRGGLAVSDEINAARAPKFASLQAEAGSNGGLGTAPGAWRRAASGHVHLGRPGDDEPAAGLRLQFAGR